MNDIGIRLSRMDNGNVAAEPVLEILSFSGTESVSVNFELTFTLVLADSSDIQYFCDELGNVNSGLSWRIDMDAAPGIVNDDGFSPEPGTRYIHCLTSRVQQVSQRDQTYLKVTMSPLMLPLSHARRTKTHREVSVVDIAQNNIDRLSTFLAGVAQVELQNNLSDSAAYPKWAFRVQYRETDWDFLKRCLERDGIYFFYEHTETVTRVHLCDGYDGHQDVSEVEGVLARTDEAVLELSRETEIVPEHVCVSGYQYQAKGVNLWATVAMADATQSAPPVAQIREDMDSPHTVFTEGLVITPEPEADSTVITQDIQRLVRRRAQELRSEANRICGVSINTLLRPGDMVQLAGYDDICSEDDYLFIVKVEHETLVSESGADAASYRNRFEARMVAGDAVVQYRPPRLTERPLIHGFLTGFIVRYRYPETANPSKADRDEIGRFNVVFQFDAFSGTEGEKNVHRMRMMQPSAGSRGGSYRALYEGTEIAIGFMAGDPDQPFIAGAFHNTVDVDRSLRTATYT